MEEHNNTNISFIIPAFNCAATLEEAVLSIVETNMESGDEIILVNDASTDRTLQLCLELEKRYSGKLRTVSHHINKGSAAAARNTAIDICRHELLFCLDADNVLSKHSITKLKAYMIQTGSDCAAFGEIKFFSKSVDVCDKLWTLNSVSSFIDNINHTEKTPCSSGNYLFTKSSWKKAGRYNESVGGAYDSWAFGCNQLATGSKMVTLKDTCYYHRIGYESTFVKEVKKQNTSLLMTRILIPHFHLLDEEDVNYILSPEHRNTWFDNISYRPLRSGNKSISGDPRPESIQEPTFTEILKFIKAKIKRRVS